MNRTLIRLFAAGLAAASFAAAAQTPEARYKVYMALWRGMTDAEKGFVAYFEENKIPVEFIFRNAEEDKSRVPGFVEEIKATKPDLVYAFGTTLTLGLVGKVHQQDWNAHVTDQPVVFNIVADPVGAKLTDKLEGTGRNLTGASHVVPLDTQVNAIRTVGEFKVVGALYNPLEANSRLAVDQLEKALAQHGVRLARGPVPVADDKPVLEAVPEVAAKLAQEGAQLVYLPSDSFIIANAATVVPAIHAQGIPTFSATESPIRKAGALIGIVSNYYTVGKFAGFKAKQILVDKKPAGEIPIETLAKYTFVVNQDSMRQLKYYPPVTVLQFAEVVSRGGAQ